MSLSLLSFCSRVAADKKGRTGGDGDGLGGTGPDDGGLGRAEIAVTRALDATFEVPPGIDGMAAMADESGRLYVSGPFSSHRGATTRGIFRMLPDGTVD